MPATHIAKAENASDNDSIPHTRRGNAISYEHIYNASAHYDAHEYTMASEYGHAARAFHTARELIRPVAYAAIPHTHYAPMYPYTISIVLTDMVR